MSPDLPSEAAGQRTVSLPTGIATLTRCLERYVQARPERFAIHETRQERRLIKTFFLVGRERQ